MLDFKKRKKSISPYFEKNIGSNQQYTVLEAQTALCQKKKISHLTFVLLKNWAKILHTWQDLYGLQSIKVCIYTFILLLVLVYAMVYSRSLSYGPHHCTHPWESPCPSEATI